MKREELDFEFIEAHAQYLSQLAQSLTKTRDKAVRPTVAERVSLTSLR